MGWLSGQLHGVSGETPGRWPADSKPALASTTSPSPMRVSRAFPSPRPSLRSRPRPCVERSAAPIGLDERLGLLLADAADLERHRDAGEARRIAGRADALDGDVQAADGNSHLARVAFDQRHAARGDAGEEHLAVGERVRLRARRRVEREMLATDVAFRATDHSHARRPDRIDLVTAHVCRASFTRSGVNGTRRRRTPGSANPGLAMAAGTGQAGGPLA